MTPPNYFLILLLLSLGLHFVLPIKRIIYPPYIYFGYLFIVFGGVLNIWADTLFKKSKTTVKPNKTPTSLETSGPFRISRHPMYLGMVAILLGVAIVHGTIITFIFPLFFAVLMEIKFIPLEEKNLEKAFDEEYRKYKKKVRRWI